MPRRKPFALVAALACLPLATACGLSVPSTPGGGPEPSDEDPPVNLEPEPGALRAVVEMAGTRAAVGAPRLVVSAAVADALADTACASLVTVGDDESLTFTTGGGTEGALHRWLADAMRDPAGGLSGTLRLIVGSDDQVACVVQLPAPSLARGSFVAASTPGALTSDGVELEWKVEEGESAIPGDPSSHTPPADITSPHEPVAIALLLPAVQKVREAAARSDEASYPFFDVSGGTPPPLELILDEEAVDDLFPPDTEEATVDYYLKLPDIEGESDDENAEAEDTRDLAPWSLAFRATVALDAGGRVLATPSAPGRVIVGGVTVAQGDVNGVLAALSAALPETFDGSAFDQARRYLDSQPAPTGADPVDVEALREHWTPPGAAPKDELLSDALAEALRVAADEEGVFSYALSPFARSLFDRLSLDDGRRLDGVSANDVLEARLWAAASLSSLPGASLPMAPAQLVVTGDGSGAHSYAAALGAMRSLAELAPPLDAGEPQQLVGILPDEIDVALDVEDAMTLTVVDVDRAALVFLAALAPVLDPDGDPDVDAVYEAAAALSEKLAELRRVSEARRALRLAP